jgi:sec-independent protein translocase protein TatA
MEQMLAFMSLFAFLGNLGGPDLIIVLLIILVLFGAKKLPELARGMGSAIKEFQKAKDEFSDELHSAGKTEAAKPAATVPRIENAPTIPTATAGQPSPDQAPAPNPDRTDRV